MMALTDERVLWEKTPFDHPELYIFNGARGDPQKVKTCGVPGVACDDKPVKITAVGAADLRPRNGHLQERS